jgi:hypothetical protein
VIHGDVSARHWLRSPQTGGLRLIDFDRAILRREHNCLDGASGGAPWAEMCEEEIMEVQTLLGITFY